MTPAPAPRTCLLLQVVDTVGNNAPRILVINWTKIKLRDGARNKTLLKEAYSPALQVPRCAPALRHARPSLHCRAPLPALASVSSRALPAPPLTRGPSPRSPADLARRRARGPFRHRAREEGARCGRAGEAWPGAAVTCAFAPALCAPLLAAPCANQSHQSTRCQAALLPKRPFAGSLTDQRPIGTRTRARSRRHSRPCAAACSKCGFRRKAQSSAMPSRSLCVSFATRRSLRRLGADRLAMSRPAHLPHPPRGAGAPAAEAALGASSGGAEEESRFKLNVIITMLLPLSRG